MCDTGVMQLDHVMQVGYVMQVWRMCDTAVMNNAGVNQVDDVMHAGSERQGNTFRKRASSPKQDPFPMQASSLFLSS